MGRAQYYLDETKECVGQSQGGEERTEQRIGQVREVQETEKTGH